MGLLISLQGVFDDLDWRVSDLNLASSTKLNGKHPPKHLLHNPRYHLRITPQEYVEEYVFKASLDGGAVVLELIRLWFLKTYPHIRMYIDIFVYIYIHIYVTTYTCLHLASEA